MLSVAYVKVPMQFEKQLHSIIKFASSTYSESSYLFEYIDIITHEHWPLASSDVVPELQTELKNISGFKKKMVVFDLILECSKGSNISSQN